MTSQPEKTLCLVCGAEIAKEFSFCPQCGVRLKSEASWRGERRFVTIIFADVSGFSRMTERMDPEDVTFFLNTTFEKLEKIILGYGGTVDKYIGDCVMALFGVPKALGNDAERACLAAIDMIAAVRELNESKILPDKLNLTIGVNAGTVIVGAIGGAKSKQNTVIGDAVNVSQRLQSIAQAGQILTSRRVVRLCEDRIRFESMGEFYVKGKSEPIPSYLVISRRDRAEASTLDFARRTIFVDRIAEQKKVADLLKKTKQDSQNRALACIGKPGVGRSRLGEECGKIASKLGYLVAMPPPLEFSGGKDYGLITSIIERFLFAYNRITSEESENLTKSSMEILQSLNLEEAVKTRIAELLGKEAEKVAELEETARRFSIYYAIRTLLELIGKQYALYVLIPNLQWADNASLGFLLHLDNEPLSVPAFWFLTAETAKSMPFKNNIQTETIELKEMAKEDTLALAQAFSKNVAIEPELAELLWTRSGGSPFYLEELISSLWYQEAIETRDGELALKSKKEDLELPDSLTATIAARIDRLPEYTADSIRRAAVIGRKFSVDILSRISEVEMLDEAISMLDEQGFIRRIPGDADDVWTFVHDLTREVAYEGLLLADRKKLHLKVAEAIAATGDDIARADELAYHFRLAGDVPRFLYYLLLSAKQGQQNCQYDAAFQSFDEALETLTKHSILLEEQEEADLQRWTLSAYTGRGEIFLIRAEHDKAREDFIRGLDKARILNDANAEILLEADLAKLYLLSGDPDFSLVHGKEALRMAEKSKNEPGRALSFHRIGLAYLRKGDINAAKNMLEKALEIRTRIGDKAGISASLNTLGNVLLRLGEEKKTRGYYEQSLTICREIGDRLGLAACLNNLGNLLSGDSDFKGAVTYLEEAQKIKREIGDLRGLAAALVNLAIASHELKEFDKALEFAEKAREASEKSRFTIALIEAGYVIARTYAAQSKFKDAEKELTAMIAKAEEAGLAEEKLTGKLVSAEIELARKNDQKAKEIINAIIQEAVSAGFASIVKEAEKRLGKINEKA